MNAITIHPKNEEQLLKLESLLTDLEIPFENQTEIKSKELLGSIERGLKQSDSGEELINLETFKNTFSLK
jgi:hypothetical protein